MKRLFSAAVLAAVLVAFTPLAGAQSTSHAEYLLTTPYPSVVTEPGSQVKLKLTAYAPDTEPVDIGIDGLPDGWDSVLRGGGFVVTGVTANPDRGGSIDLEVTVPVDAEPGDYPVTVTENGSAGTDRLALTITVAPVVDNGIGITADFPALTGGPDDTFTYTLTVANNTPTDQTFTFVPSGPQGWNVTSAPTAEQRANTVTIAAGDTADVRVKAEPSATATAGDYQIGVEVETDSGAKGSFTLQATIIGTGKLSFSTATGRLDASGTAGSTGRVPFIVANTGSGPLDNVKFAATAPKDWDVSFEPSTIDEIQPGDTANVTAVIRPKSDAVAGDYAITMRSSAGSESQTVDLRYTLSTSSWLGFVGAAIIIVAIAGGMLVFRRVGRR